MDIELTSAQVAQLRQIQREGQHSRRYKKVTVVLMLHHGFRIRDIELALGIDDNTINRYVKKLNEVGIEKYLKDAYKGKVRMLSADQEHQLVDELKNTLYCDVASIINYVHNHFGVKFSDTGMRTVLHRLGFVYKQTKSVSSKADDLEQQEFLTEKLSPLLEEVIEGKSVIYYSDGCHPTHNTKTGKGWILKGEDFIVDSNSGRQRLNINAAVNATKPEHLVYETTDTINTQSTKRLCQKLLRKHPKKNIYVVCDNARYNRNKMLTEWAANTRIKFVYLPPYSPNLNIIERLWRLMRKEVINSIYYDTYAKFKIGVTKFLDNSKDYKSELRSLLTLNFRTVEGTSYHAQF